MFARVNKMKLLYWLLIAAGVYALLPFLLIAPFNQPAADDYVGAVRDAHQSFATVFTNTYMHWSGRYFATVIARINPLLYHSTTAYKWYAVILLAAFVTALIILTRTLTLQYFSWLQTLALSSLILFLYLTVLPSTAEGFYWFSGAWVYQTANIFFMLLLALLIRLQSGIGKTTKYFCLLLAALLSVCVIGCNEISLIITCATVIFFALNKFIADKKLASIFNTLAVICITAACIAVFAPGNFERMDNSQEYSKSPVWTVAGATGITFIYLTKWATPVLICTILYVPLFGNPLAKKILAKGVQVKLKLSYSIAFFIALFLLLQLFTVWVAGGSNLGRIENVIYLYFLLGYFFNVQLFINRYYQKQQPVSFFSKPLLAIVVLLFFMNLFDINNNISTAYIDVVTGKAKRYSNQLNARAKLVTKCKQDTCFVPPLTALPATIFFTDIKCTTDSLDFWMNDAYSTYMGAHYLLVSAPLPPVKTNMETLQDFAKELRNDVFENNK